MLSSRSVLAIWHRHHGLILCIILDDTQYYVTSSAFPILKLYLESVTMRKKHGWFIRTTKVFSQVNIILRTYVNEWEGRRWNNYSPGGHYNRLVVLEVPWLRYPSHKKYRTRMHQRDFFNSLHLTGPMSTTTQIYTPSEPRKNPTREDFDFWSQFPNPYRLKPFTNTSMFSRVWWWFFAHGGRAHTRSKRHCDHPHTSHRSVVCTVKRFNQICQGTMEYDSVLASVDSFRVTVHPPHAQFEMFTRRPKFETLIVPTALNRPTAPVRSSVNTELKVLAQITGLVSYWSQLAPNACLELSVQMWLFADHYIRELVRCWILGRQYTFIPGIVQGMSNAC